MKKTRFSLKILAVSVLFVMLCMSAFAADFKDTGSHWSKEYVNYGVEKGYINGYPDGTFLPDKKVTRAEFSKMLNSAIGVKETDENKFFDVEKSAWYYDEVLKASFAGYISGYEDGSFKPTHNITRQEAAIILSRLATKADKEVKISDFKDADDIADWAEDAVEFAYAKGYFSGDDLGRFLPTASLTRGQAAKILYELTEGENFYSGDYIIDLEKAVLSETIFTGNVVFEVLEDAPSVSFEGCKILGTLKLNTTKECAVKINDTTIKNLIVSGKAVVVADDDTKIKNIKASSPCELYGEGYGNITLSGSDLISGITKIDCDADKVTVNSSSIISFGDDIENFEVTGKCSLTVQNGKIKNMNVASSAANSVITLAKDVTVTSLTVYGRTTFMGEGTIIKSVEKVDGVFYETLPENKTESEDSTEGDGFVPGAVTPSAGKTNVSTLASITITFDNAIYDKNGDTPSSSYLEGCFEIRKSSTTGSKVSFIPVLTTSKKVVLETITEFAGKTKYYVIVKANTLFDEDDNPNAKYTFNFTTAQADDEEEEDEIGGIKFSPANGEKEVDTDKSIKITFPKAICIDGGDDITSSHIEKNAIELRKKSTSGDLVDFTAEISSTDKVVTITPEENLNPDTKYYVIIKAGELEYSNGTNVSKTTMYFTTDDSFDISVTPKSATTGVSADTEIVIKFNSPATRPNGASITSSYVINEGIELRKTSASGAKVTYTALVSSDKQTITIIPNELLAGTKYYVVIPAGVFENESEVKNSKVTSYFTVASEMTPVADIQNGDTGISPEKTIDIMFTEQLFDKEGNEITPEYVESKVVKLREKSSSGDDVPFTAVINDNGNTITIVPDEAFATYSKYYLSVAKNTLYNENEKGNSALTLTFTTSSTNKPDFIPYNGEEDVSVETDIEIIFEEKMYQIGGASLTSTYVKNNVVELYEENEDGALVDITVTVNNSTNTIKISPKKNLSGETTYMLVVRSASMEDANEEENEKYVSYFTTSASASKEITITPASASKNIPTSTSIILEFDSGVYRTNGNNISSAYILNNVLELRKTSSSGTKVACTVEISDNYKKLELIPEKNLEKNTKYYVKLLSDTLEYADGTKVPSKSIYFTTSDGSVSVTEFTFEDSTASSASFTVDATDKATATVTVYNTSGKAVSSASKEIEDVAEIISVTGLSGNTKYTAKLSLKDSEGDVVNYTKSISFETTETLEVEVTDVDDSSATVVVTANNNGAVTIAYRKSTGDATVIRSGLELDKNETREFVINGLDADTKYFVDVEFTDEYDGKESKSVSFTTEELKEEVLTIDTIRVKLDNGETSKATIDGDTAEVVIGSTEKVQISVESEVENSVFTVNGGSETQNGAYSAGIDISSEEDNEIEITLTSNDTNNSVTCILTVKVMA